MRYAIVINLDYDSHPYDEVTRLFEEIREGMLRHGFRMDGRIFTINLPADEAGKLARQVIEDIDAYESYHGKQVYSYIKDFYGFDMSLTTNLLLPASDEISVTELDMDETELFGKKES